MSIVDKDIEDFMNDPMNERFVSKALVQLTAIDQHWKCHRHSTHLEIEWSKENTDPEIPLEQIVAQAMINKEEYEYNYYQVQRYKTYPTVVEQLDMLYHGGYEGWKAMIEEIKNQYPKPE